MFVYFYPHWFFLISTQKYPNFYFIYNSYTFNHVSQFWKFREKVQVNDNGRSLSHTHMYIHNFPRLKLYTLAKGIYIYRLKRSSKGDNSPVMLSHARIVLRRKNFPFVPFQFIKFAWRETTTIFIRCIA